jgi:hypothetical protein
MSLGKALPNFHRNKNSDALALGRQLPGKRLKLRRLADMPEPLDNEAGRLVNEAPHLG